MTHLQVDNESKFYQAKGENIKQYIEFNPSIAAKEEQLHFVGNQYPSYNTLLENL